MYSEIVVYLFSRRVRRRCEGRLNKSTKLRTSKYYYHLFRYCCYRIDLINKKKKSLETSTIVKHSDEQPSLYEWAKQFSIVCELFFPVTFFRSKLNASKSVDISTSFGVAVRKIAKNIQYANQIQRGFQRKLQFFFLTALRILIFKREI